MTVEVDLLGALAVDHDGDRVGDADGVGHLHLAALGEAGGDDVLGHVPGGVGAGAVDLARVLAGEGAAAVRSGAAVGVDDDLAAGEAAVAHGAADDELAGGVDDRDVLELVHVVEVLRQDRLDHVLEQVGVDDALQVGALGVLRGEHHLDDLDRLAVLVAHRDLALAVRAQVREDLGLAHVGEPARELVRERDGQRHELGRLGAGEAEHHALVAGALGVEHVVVVDVGALLQRLVDALADVRRLRVDGRDDAAGVAVEAVGGVVVADVADGLPDDLGDLHVGVRGDLAGDHDHAGGDHGLAGHATVRVVGEDGVEDGVGDLVGDLVGMTLGDRFRSEEVSALFQVSPPTDSAGEPADLLLLQAAGDAPETRRSLPDASDGQQRGRACAGAGPGAALTCRRAALSWACGP